jgi:hypothetical protein
MARLLRQSYTKPIPPGAEIIDNKGKPHARYKADGKTVLAPLTRNGERVRLKSEKWYGEYADRDGVVRRVPLSTDKTAAGQMLRELVGKSERGKAGLADPFEEQHARPLKEHLEDYRRHLEAEGNGAEHVRNTCAQIRRVLEGCKFTSIPDLLLQAGGVGGETLYVALQLRGFPQLLTQQELAVDQLQRELEILAQVGVQSQVVLRRDSLAEPPALALVDEQGGGDLGRRGPREAGEEVADVGPLALPPELPQLLSRRRSQQA